MNAIYVVTVVKNANEGRRTRMWGWYSDFAEAEKDVVSNATDIFEMDYYDHAVIERHEEGVCAPSDVVAWYFADYSNDPKYRNPHVRKIATPAWARGLVGWAS